ncbi:helix-turn-helix transcriptional regulator [Brevundimonas sp.]|uniref:ArsR/SmtB family transcription factor n=1 Tax=Brevundimonas sp. TaxID=1871086 RepID=UPI00272FB0A1|nr:metalloregulator ArsR/SmtB family transcription factor [Brevundimonas sp.]MDP1911937.1 metalloregulator ArsR/SmtB family transcription factor [Brevundimonas sp.]
MDGETAIQALSALAQSSRLAVFRALVRAGPEGLAAGVIARRVEVTPSTLSTHLNVLLQAGLVASRRAGRSIVYSARFDRMAALMAFLAEDCCGGAAEVCGPVAEAAARAACRSVAAS